MTIRFRTDPADGRDGLAASAKRNLSGGGDVFPGRKAPTVQMDADGRMIHETMQWGFPPFKGKRPVCHVANTTSIYWRAWLKPEWRCAIPARAFSEYSGLDHRAHWYGPTEGDVFWLAALWRPLSGKRTPPLPPANVDPRLFALLNAPPNRLIADHHPASMPTVLRKSELQTWLLAPKEIAFELRRPLNARLLQELA